MKQLFKQEYKKEHISFQYDSIEEMRKHRQKMREDGWFTEFLMSQENNLQLCYWKSTDLYYNE